MTLSNIFDRAVVKIVKGYYMGVRVLNGTNYLIMDEVKFVEDNL